MSQRDGGREGGRRETRRVGFGAPTPQSNRAEGDRTASRWLAAVARKQASTAARGEQRRDQTADGGASGFVEDLRARLKSRSETEAADAPSVRFGAAKAQKPRRHADVALAGDRASAPHDEASGGGSVTERAAALFGTVRAAAATTRRRALDALAQTRLGERFSPDASPESLRESGTGTGTGPTGPTWDERAVAAAPRPADDGSFEGLSAQDALTAYDRLAKRRGPSAEPLAEAWLPLR